MNFNGVEKFLGLDRNVKRVVRDISISVGKNIDIRDKDIRERENIEL